MPIETWERTGDSGAFVKLGDAAPNGTGSGDASAPAGSAAHAAPGQGDATAGQAGETSAPPSDAPGGPPPAQAAPAGPPPGDDDDTEEPGDPDAALTVARFNRRMGQLTRYRRQAERDLAAERETTAQLRAQMDLMTRLVSGAAPDMPAPTSDPTAPPVRPNAADYTDQATYDQAMETWLDRRTQHTMQQQTQAMQAQAALQAREAAFVAQHPDFVQVVQTHLAGQ